MVATQSTRTMGVPRGRRRDQRIFCLKKKEFRDAFRFSDMEGLLYLKRDSVSRIPGHKSGSIRGPFEAAEIKADSGLAATGRVGEFASSCLAFDHDRSEKDARRERGIDKLAYKSIGVPGGLRAMSTITLIVSFISIWLGV
jgi:hypothetical protein